VEQDALSIVLPDRPFKVVSNLPFHLSSPLLRKLLDESSGRLLRAELVVAWGFAIGRASIHPTRLAGLSWQPWFELVVTRRLPARLFQPAPAADAAVLSVRRRPVPLLAWAERGRFLALARHAYRAGGRLRDALGGERAWRQWEWLAEELGFRPDAGAAELDVWQWVAVFRLVSAIRPAAGRR
jgi:23S rRNA (adenine-N6)-dimethyltransferase